MTCGCVNQADTDPIPILSGPARSDRELVDPAILEVNDNGGRLRLVPDECRSEEHTSELQSLMRTSYAVFCLKKKKQHATNSERMDSMTDLRATHNPEQYQYPTYQTGATHI